MGKYCDLIDRLDTSGKHDATAYQALIEADGRAFRPLVWALLKHPNENIRHEVAEIHGKRRQAKAIPALIEALSDPSLYVRQDAQWSIEKICRMEIGALGDWLGLDEDPDITVERAAENKRKVEAWWAVNRQFLKDKEF